MRLDWWVSYEWGVSVECDEVQVYSRRLRSSIVLVESQEEHDLASALQYIHGQEVNLQVWDKSPIAEYRKCFSQVFTSWDPLDPNRI